MYHLLALRINTQSYPEETLDRTSHQEIPDGPSIACTAWSTLPCHTEASPILDANGFELNEYHLQAANL